ncbi:MAG: thiol reductant ABC exporter subunit CydC [Acetobacteraceae bacterium]|nr:thiol reductant ABC exporter subunit CydC [Acetobacteraceae bacterium]
MRELGRILVLWRRQSLWLAFGAVVTLAATAAGVALMAVSGRLIAAAVVVGVLVAPVLLRLLGVGRVVLRYLERLVTHEATFRALADLRIWFFRRLAAGAAGGLGFRHAGDVLARLVGDVDALDGLYLRILLPLAGALMLLPVIALFVGERDPVLGAVVAVLFVIAAFLLPWIAARGTEAAGTRLAGSAGALRVKVLDALTGLREVRAFGAEGRMLAEAQAREATLFSAQRALATRTALASAAALLCGQAAIFAILLAVGADPVGSVAAAFLVAAAFEAVGGLPRAGALAGHAAAAARRVLEVADAPAAVADPTEPAPPPSSSTLRFETVRFQWEADRPLVLDALSLEVPPGSRVAIVGPSGAGKSSLAALALKVAAPESGRILLGGTDIAALAAETVRARIGWLSQATHLFDDTIRANLLLARPDAEDAALLATLDAARIGEFVRSLPDGLDTWVGEGGSRVSGGQGRRLALARTLLSPAPILILDEPCAGLDSETERAFLATLNETALGRSIILLAHRLTGVERLDRIYRLSGGRAIAAAA